MKVKGFNRKSFASLAASAMVAAATLTPVSGIFISGIAHAAAPTDFVQVNGPARFIDAEHVNVTLTYKCAPIPVGGKGETLTVFVAQANPGATGTSTPITNPPALCNNQPSPITVSVPNQAANNAPFNANYNLGPLAVTAQLLDSNGVLTATTTQVVNVVQ
jgi:hypothetical protein